MTEHVPAIPRLCRYLSERSPQPMVAVDGTTHIVSYVNPAFAELVGMEIKQLIGRPFSEAVPEGVENGCLALLDRVFHSGVAESSEEQEHRQTQPQSVYWSYFMWPILGEDERPLGVMIQITEATEVARFRQQAVAMNESLLISAARQHELKQVAEALSARLQVAVSARDHFLAILSHELRNPLAAISNGMELLKLAVGNQELAESCREMIDRQLKQMVKLVDDLLDVSRITTGKLELRKQRVELNSVLRESVEASRALINAGDHSLTVEMPPGEVWLDADPTRLAQIFLNLLNNAAKYSQPHGSIRLVARVDGSEIEVSVQDQGVGIPPAKLDHIFEMFMQVDVSWERTQGGMGIGLSLVKEFVDLHGGRVEARSPGLGQGSEFLVRLPLTSGSDKQNTIAVELPRGPQRRILVVDDNRDAAESLAMLLKMMGHEVRTAHGGEAAVSVAAEYRPMLVLLDLGMPQVDGYEAARRIRSQPWGAEMYLAALSGWGAKDDRIRTQDCGFDRHLVKPADIEALKQLIADLPSN